MLLHHVCHLPPLEKRMLMAKVVGSIASINVGRPQEVEWNGRKVRTAIFKSPVKGKVWAGCLNIAGDGQADLQGHGGEQRAIMVYQLESYEFWQNHLRRSDFVMGQFGENLTVQGLPDNEVCIGDRYLVGGALVGVSQPRVTCFKVGLRLGNPQMPALLVARKRPGFYFRVLQEGELAAGDPIEKVADGPERISVAEMDALLYSSEHPRSVLERAVRISALNPGWRQSMDDLLDAEMNGHANGNAGLVKAGAPLAWKGLKRVKVIRTWSESLDVRSFTLADADGGPLPDAAPGQHIAVRVSRPEGLLMRNYSLCGPQGRGQFQIAVKREPQGMVSSFLHEHVRAGDHLEVSAPRGTFILPPATSPIVLISAGVGITPVLAMLLAATAKGAPSRSIWWLHVARNKAYHSFSKQIRELAAQHPVQVRTIFTQPEPMDQSGVDFDLAGHLDREMLRALPLPSEADFYLCGPTPFMDGVTDALRGCGADTARIHQEAFGPDVTVKTEGSQAPHPPVGASGKGPKVTFLRSRVSAIFDEHFNSLLELTEACDVPVHWSCRTGVCHNCESGLVGGSVAYAPDPIDPPAPGSVLICCSRPEGEVELDL
jgi:ferredoxin-NADP reductase/MOSC domain-containing protein YiiM